MAEKHENTGFSKLINILKDEKTCVNIIMELITPPYMRFPCSFGESQTSKFFNHVPFKGLGRYFEIMSESSENPEKVLA